MKLALSADLLPAGAALVACSSHEERCLGLLSNLKGWVPAQAILFHYDDDNPIRERNHALMEKRLLDVGVTPVALGFTETNAVRSLRENMAALRRVVTDLDDSPIVLDISVFTRRHLLMLLQWIDDAGLWDRLTVVYTEPEDYDVSDHLPLSFGLASVRQIPGFPACANLSRPVHLVLFLGYEGDRALAAYEHVQPMKTTLMISDPPSHESWSGRTERFNADLLKLVGEHLVRRVDAIDPDATTSMLESVFGDPGERGAHAKIVCPLGTKPQTLGVYAYIRDSHDPPAVVYAGPLRHNHEFFSHGSGTTWVLKRGRT